jgi:EpsD family peptidyl-prolyl cis-trans isomerase
MRIAFQAAVAVLIATLLWSCGNKPSREIIAARVNGTEISLTDVRGALERIPSGAADKALEALIDEELFVQKALANRLNERSVVAQALRAARRQILAQAYLQQVIASASSDDKQAIRAYYEANPQLFAERRSYRIFELSFSAGAVDLPRLEEKLRSTHHLSDVADWLRSRNVRFQLDAGTRVPEQIPAELLGRIAAMHDGDMQLWRSGDTAFVVQLAQSESASVSETQALPAIERHLLAKNRLDSASAALKNLRSAAKIEYVMDFSVKNP